MNLECSMHSERERSEVQLHLGRMVMGKGKRAEAPLMSEVGKILVVFLCLFPSVSLECKILKCNSEFWASSSSTDPEEELCTALRAYNNCVHHTARTCRGDLAYHSAQHGVEDLMSQHNCSKVGPTTQPPAWTTSPPPQLQPDRQEGTNVLEQCHYENSFPHSSLPNYTHCGFFGDPHLRTFRDNFQTCKVEGAWPLIHNKYMSVQVTNTPVVPGSSATATSKLTIIFKDFQECVDQKMYHAETDELPAAFADGSNNGGDHYWANTLRIVEKMPGQHVEIQARYIGTTIVIRQVGRFLTFAVRMPEDVVNSVEDRDNQDLYLCLHGCPTNQRIDFRTFRTGAVEVHNTSKSQTGSPHHGFTYQAAMAKCKERLPVEDLYFESCVFDLFSSGDIDFTMAAYYAFQDVKMLHSNKDKYHIFERDAFVINVTSRGSDMFSIVCIKCLGVLLWFRSCLIYM